jgi:hypothetical protein
MAVEHNIRIDSPRVTFEGMRVSWGGVWAGVLVVLGTLLLLSTLGVAIGFSVDARNVDPDKVGAGVAIWSRASLLLALFLGGMGAARMSMVWDRFSGLAQGVLVWVVSLIVVLFLSANGVGLMLGAGLVYGALQRVEHGPGMTAWITFFSILLSLFAALAGSAIGQHRAAARVEREVE